ncbi:MAG: MFS transporter, partial [Novosphingobium sp.]
DLTGFALLAICLTAIQMLLDRGNHVDWFDSAESWIYLAVAVSTGWMALVHFATSAQPLFDRGLFANSNFVVAMMISVVIGVVMFATMALLPPMLQHLFGYTVIDTGEALVPRGIGTMISMQLAGWLVRRGVDPRIMITLGFSIAAWSLWDMAGWSLAVDREAIMLAGLVQGIGMGMVFIPMNSVAFATLSPQLRTDGASLLNLCRSIGSSIGIAVTTAFAARSIQVSHADLAGHVTASASSMIDVSATERFQTAGETALRMVDAEVNRQAAMIAYVNDFWLMMWLALAAVPLALLLRRQTTVPRF